nr:type VI secretion system ImpA family N-terminal domain-containing protein [Limnobacter humi]
MPSPSGASSGGPNLEYDNRFLALVQASHGRPESQFEPAVPPDWTVVERDSLRLLNESRDLRLVCLLLQSQLALHGLAHAVPVLVGWAELVRRCWPVLNPPLDDGDPYPRLQVIESMGSGSPFFQTFRGARVYQHVALGDLRIRDFEPSAGTVQASGSAFNRDQLVQFLHDHPAVLAELLSTVQASRAALDDLSAAYAHWLPGEPLPALEALSKAIDHIAHVLPELPPVVKTPNGLDVSAVPEPTNATAAALHSLTMEVHNRAQALQAIDAVCRYLEQAEPTSPAQWLLKRARRLIDKNFLELVKDLAPDALSDVARIMGVDPESLNQSDGSG